MLRNNQKSIIKGLSLVVFITLMNFTVLTLLGNINNSSSNDQGLFRDPLFTSEPFEWDGSSALSLSGNIESRSENLLHVSFSSSIITNLLMQEDVTCSDDKDREIPCEGKGDFFGWTGESVAILNYNVTHFLAYVNEENQNWYLTIDRSISYDEMFAIPVYLLDEIHPAFTLDLDHLENFTDSDNNQIFQEVKLGDLVLNIMLIYDDGTLLSIQSMGTNIAIHLDRCTNYIGTLTMMGCETDLNFEDMYYYANSNQQFPNYITALNDILDIVLIGD